MLHESLWCKGVAIFSNDGESTDWSFQLSVILQEISSVLMATSASSQRVLSIGGPVVKSRTNLKSSHTVQILYSLNDILFQQCSYIY